MDGRKVDSGDSALISNRSGAIHGRLRPRSRWNQAPMGLAFEVGDEGRCPRPAGRSR